MSKRRSIYTILKRRCDGGKPPNKYIPEITIEIRAHFPPHVSFLEVADALKTNYDHAMKELRDSYPEHSCEIWEESDVQENCITCRYRRNRKRVKES